MAAPSPLDFLEGLLDCQPAGPALSALSAPLRLHLIRVQKVDGARERRWLWCTLGCRERHGHAEVVDPRRSASLGQPLVVRQPLQVFPLLLAEQL